VDKITGKGLSSTDFTQAEKTKLGLITGTNTGDQDLSSLATKAELEDDYAKLDEENSFSEDQIFESRINFSDENNSSIRAFDYEGYPGGIMISNDQLIFIGRGEDDPEEFEGWSFNVGERTLRFPDGKTEMEQDGNVFYIDSENDLFLTSGLENDEGKWGTIGMSSYEQLFLEIFNANSMQEAGISLFHEDGDEIDMEVKIYNSEKYWRFDPSGTLTLPNNSKISDDGQGLGINTEGAIFILSGSMENEEEFEDNEDELLAGLNLNKEFGINFFISGEEGGASISINQAYEDDIHVNVNNLGYEWVFDSEGRLKFPNNTHISDSEGTFRIESPNALVFMGDLDNEDFGASIAISPDEWYDSEGDIDESLETQGSIFITTLDLDDDIFNTWKFGESGNLVFPDGTLFGVLEGDNTIGFETKENSDFLLVTSDGVDPFEWAFTKDGELIFPDGTLFGEVEGSGTIGFVTEEDSDFFILTGDEEFEWVFTNDGSLNFPDGTTFNYVPDDGTVGFTSTDNTDFIIATSSNYDYEWQFTKDGKFKLPGLLNSGFPGPASFQMTNNGTFSPSEALEITSPNAFILKSEANQNDVLWNFEGNGNTTFPADFAVGGALKVNWGGFSENIFDVIIHKFESETFTISDFASFNAATSLDYTLDVTPRSIDQVAMFVNGGRVPRDKYSLDARTVTYTKIPTTYPGPVTIRFDYFKN
jgi:hypothetical protein